MSFPGHSPLRPSIGTGDTSHLSSFLHGDPVSLSKDEAKKLLGFLQTTACELGDAEHHAEDLIYTLRTRRQSSKPSLTSSSESSPSPSPSPSLSSRSSQSTSFPSRSASSKDEKLDPESPTSLREHARRLRGVAAKVLEASELALSRGDIMLSQQYAGYAARLNQEMLQSNALASELLFRVNNRHRNVDQVDLHGLYVGEALQYTERCIAVARRLGMREITFIVGRGLHSVGGTPKLGPAVVKKLRRMQLEPFQHPKNPGMLITRLAS